MSEKEVTMDIQDGGKRRSRKRGVGRRRKTESTDATVVTKDDSVKTPASVPAPVVAPSSVVKSVPAKIVLAPPKKKPAKLMLVPKGKTVAPRHQPAKTFKAKRLQVTIDNTAKTQKQRKSVLSKVEAMTEDQVRAAAVAVRLSRRETVAKVPINLLREMLKDYQMMRKSLV